LPSFVLLWQSVGSADQKVENLRSFEGLLMKVEEEKVENCLQEGFLKEKQFSFGKMKMKTKRKCVPMTQERS
jgi:hypothetical protein